MYITHSFDELYEDNLKPITLHGLNEDLDRIIRKKAKESGKSINKTIKDILEKAIGINRQKDLRRSEFLDLFGIWSEEDAKQFTVNIKDFEKIDAGDWQ